jgi:hypothetical protein
VVRSRIGFLAPVLLAAIAGGCRKTIRDDPIDGLDPAPVSVALKRAASDAEAVSTRDGVVLEVLRRDGSESDGMKDFDLCLTNHSGRPLICSGAGDAFSGRPGDASRPAYGVEKLNSKTLTWDYIGFGYCGNGLAPADVPSGSSIRFPAKVQTIVCDELGWIRFTLHFAKARGEAQTIKAISRPVRLRPR